jgi:hypothetical protein
MSEPVKPKNYSRIFRKLSDPLPPEAIEQIAGKDFSSIKTAYIVERLNEVLGPNNWTAKYHECSTRLANSNEIALKCIITSEKYGLYAEGFGSNQDHDDIGNAYKGAKSVALKNAVMQWGLGLEVHKGLPDEGYTLSDVPPIERIKKSKKTNKFIWTSVDGIITESQEQDAFLWLGINGRTCRAMGEIKEDLDGKESWKTICQGYWCEESGIAYVHLTRLLSIVEIEPLIVPEPKRVKNANKSVDQEKEAAEATQG